MKALSDLRRFLKGFGLWGIMFPFGWLIRKLPIQFSYRVAGLWAGPAYLLAINRRRILRQEVEMLYGNRFSKERVSRVVLKGFEIYLKRQVENIAFDRITEDCLRQVVSVQGWANFRRAERKKRGVIILLAHFGSFLLPLPFLAYKKYGVHQVAGTPLVEKQGVVSRKILEARKRQTDKMPFTFLVTDKYLGPLVRALKKGDIVVIAFDGRTGNELMPMRILDRDAQFSPGPFKLAVKTGAAILPTFVVRDRDNRHRIIFEPPMELRTENSMVNSVRRNMADFVEIFEKYLIDYPCHFAMTLYTSRQEAFYDLNPPLFVD